MSGGRDVTQQFTSDTLGREHLERSCRCSTLPTSAVLAHWTGRVDAIVVDLRFNMIARAG